MHSRPEIIHFPSPSGISIGGSHGGDRGVHGLMVFKKAPRIVTSVPLIVSLQLCYRSWRRFKEACTAWWSSRKRHLQACLQSVRCSVQENAKHHRLCAIGSGCVLQVQVNRRFNKALWLLACSPQVSTSYHRYCPAGRWTVQFSFIKGSMRRSYMLLWDFGAIVVDVEKAFWQYNRFQMLNQWRVSYSGGNSFDFKSCQNNSL